jgi:hypothetical protein
MKLDVVSASGYNSRFGDGTNQIAMYLGNSGSFTGGLITTYNNVPLGFSTNQGAGTLIINGGNVGIATTTPGYALTTVGTSYFSQPVIVGTPTTASHAATKSYVDSVVGTGGGGSSNASFATITVSGTSTLNGNLSFGGQAITTLNMNNNNISGVNKLSVTTIDPLYSIGGRNYSTYAASIAGGVKEEYVGKGRIEMDRPDRNGYYTYILNFSGIESGSDLWLWRNVVDFSPDNVEVLATPIGTPVPIAYEIGGNKIIFRAQLQTTNHKLPTSIDFSYRLIGKRFDWTKWPTLAADQSEEPGLFIR